MHVTLLGPQRRPTVTRVIRSLPIEGQIATINAGWRERESDDGELNELLDGRGANLSLYRRYLDVQERDPEFAAAYLQLRHRLDDLQDIYLVRLDFALRAVDALRNPLHPAALREDAMSAAIETVRELDAGHLDAVTRLQAEFYDAWPPHDRPIIAEHRADVERLLQGAGALVITGGHLDVLLAVLHLFNVAAFLPPTLIAWSAGAIALTDRVVLFHDRAPQGPGHPEIYGRGISRVRGIVALPHPRDRLLLDDVDRMSVLARRFAPARCVLLEAGTRIDTDSDGNCPPGTRLLGEDGRVRTVEPS